MDISLIDLRGVITVLSLLAFVGIIYWTFVAHRKADFDEAAALPFADEETNNIKQEPKHG